MWKLNPKIKKLLAVISIIIILMATYYLANRRWLPSQDAAIKVIADKMVSVKITPDFKFNYAIMKPGVIQHLDRDYTYDVVPDQLIDGLLLQCMHRLPKGSEIEIKLHVPATIYFFFHYEVDGGYTAIFEQLEGWTLSKDFPQYDIYNGDHGLKMVMYEMEAQPGLYTIPPSTKKDACFNIVFQQ